jgi:hypothetical protein
MARDEEGGTPPDLTPQMLARCVLNALNIRNRLGAEQ